jgi:acyl carrier protein
VPVDARVRASLPWLGCKITRAKNESRLFPLNENLYTAVTSSIHELLTQKGVPAPDAAALTPDTELLGSDLRLDSLDLATIVVQLQELTQSDPFADEFIEFHTIGELVALFEASRAEPAA